jgi:hypothetical protein
VRILKEEMDRKTAEQVLDGLVKDREFREVFIRKLQEESVI